MIAMNSSVPSFGLKEKDDFVVTITKRRGSHDVLSLRVSRTLEPLPQVSTKYRLKKIPNRKGLPGFQNVAVQFIKSELDPSCSNKEWLPHERGDALDSECEGTTPARLNKTHK